MKVAFRPRRLGHANLFVSDLDRSLGFYGSVCGLEFVRRERALDIAFLSNGSTHHDVGLVQVRTGTRIGRDGYQQPSTGRGAQPGLNHLGFEMENEAALVDAYHRCTEAGVEVVATTDHLISRSVYLHDPDGHMLEFYSDSLPDWRTIFNPEREDLVSGAWTPGVEPPSTRHNYAVAPEIRRVADAPLHPRRMRHALLAVRDLALASLLPRRRRTRGERGGRGRRCGASRHRGRRRGGPRGCGARSAGGRGALRLRGVGRE
jgi:catechol 2,3-dioxygenase